jgi:hypothetical protein
MRRCNVRELGDVTEGGQSLSTEAEREQVVDASSSTPSAAQRCATFTRLGD